MINHALSEGMTLEDFKNLPIPPASMQDIQAVPADIFLSFTHKPVHMAGFKTSIVQFLPHIQKFKGTGIPQPASDQLAGFSVTCTFGNIGQTQIVAVID